MYSQNSLLNLLERSLNMIRVLREKEDIICLASGVPKENIRPYEIEADLEEMINKVKNDGAEAY